MKMWLLIVTLLLPAMWAGAAGNEEAFVADVLRPCMTADFIESAAYPEGRTEAEGMTRQDVSLGADERVSRFLEMAEPELKKYMEAYKREPTCSSVMDAVRDGRFEWLMFWPC